ERYTGNASTSIHNSVRFIVPQLSNLVWIVISASAAELQVEVVSWKNANRVEPGGVTGEPVGDRVACSKPVKDRIQGMRGRAGRREVASAACAGKFV